MLFKFCNTVFKGDLVLVVVFLLWHEGFNFLGYVEALDEFGDSVEMRGVVEEIFFDEVLVDSLFYVDEVFVD